MKFTINQPKKQGSSCSLTQIWWEKWGGDTWVICTFLGSPHSLYSSIPAALFSAEIYRLHGMPRSIVSDRDPLFLSNFWKTFFCLQGIPLSYSGAYHPQSDGQIEVLNQCLEAYLRSFVSDEPQKWDQFRILQSFDIILPFTPLLPWLLWGIVWSTSSHSPNLPYWQHKGCNLGRISGLQTNLVD